MKNYPSLATSRTIPARSNPRQGDHRIPAIDLKVGLTNDYLPEVITDRTILNHAREVILVADHTKCGRAASAFVAPLSRVNTFVTDDQTP